MIDVFESITPDQTDDETKKPKLPTGSRTRIKLSSTAGTAPHKSAAIAFFRFLSRPRRTAISVNSVGVGTGGFLLSNYYKAEFCLSSALLSTLRKSQCIHDKGTRFLLSKDKTGILVSRTLTQREPAVETYEETLV